VTILRVSSEAEPGIRRIRRGGGVAYRDDHGRPVTNPRTLDRIERLAIPPAWTDVWICRSPRGHIQATGRDARGRKQYRYHPEWRAEQDRTKHRRMVRFAQRLPSLRATARRHVRMRGLPQKKALATAVLILDRTAIRIGSEEYARSNGTYGLATMRSKHVTVDDDTVALDFTGKGGKRHQLEVTDAAIARAIEAMDALPGHEVLSYRDEDGNVCDVSSGDINEYIKAVAGDEFSSKDFRTWAATVSTAVALDLIGPKESERGRMRAVRDAVKAVALLIGNTPTVCRANYIDPRVIDRYMEGVTLSRPGPRVREPRRGLRMHEELTLALLRRRPRGAGRARAARRRFPAGA
jgi:DNA topoisomerase-1